MKAAWIALLLCLFAACAQAEFVSKDGWKYTFDRTENTVTVTGYAGEDAALSVPQTLGGMPVTAIGDSAFLNCAGITAATLPEGVTAVGETAFSGCTALSQISLPQSLLSVGSHAFQNTALVSLEVPAGVTRIGGAAFAGCSSLEQLTFQPREQTLELGEDLFAASCVVADGKKEERKCTALRTLVLPEGKYEIASSAFAGLPALAALSFGEGVVKLPDLSCCTGLRFLFLPESLTDADSLAAAGIPAGTEIHGKEGSAALIWAAQNGYAAVADDGSPLCLAVSEKTVCEAGDTFSLRDIAVISGGTDARLSAETASDALRIEGEKVTCVRAGTAVLLVTCRSALETVTAECTVRVYDPVTDFSFSAGGTTGSGALAVCLAKVRGNTLRVTPVTGGDTNPEYRFYWRMDDWKEGLISTADAEGIDISLTGPDGSRITHAAGTVMATAKSGVTRSARIVLYTKVDGMTLDQTEIRLEPGHTATPWVRFSLDGGAWGAETDSTYGFLPVPDGTSEQNSDWNPSWQPEGREKVPVYLTGLYTMTSAKVKVVSVSDGTLRAGLSGTANVSVECAALKKKLQLRVTVPSRRTVRLPESLTAVPEGMLRNTAAEAVVVPDGVEKIGDGAFAECPGLVTVEVPKRFSDPEAWKKWFDPDTDAGAIVVVRD